MIFTYPSALPLCRCYGVVYCLTNLRDGKRYFGICKTGRIKIRLRDHQKNNVRKQENPHLFHALNADDFKHEIIDTAMGASELFEKEKLYIKQFRSAEDEFGYNLTIGGDGRNPYFIPFEKARAYVQNLKLASTPAFYKWAASGERPKDIPGNPNVTYRGLGWVSWKDFIGSGRKPRNLSWMPYEQARGIVRPLQLKERAYRKWFKENRHLGVPLHPERVYKGEGWSGWSDYLGTDRAAMLRKRNADPEFRRKVSEGLQRFFLENPEDGQKRNRRLLAAKAILAQ